VFLIDTSIMMQRLSSGIQSCGGRLTFLTVTARGSVGAAQAGAAERGADGDVAAIRWTQPAVSIVTWATRGELEL
jgi:hypothetical protein